MRSHASSAESGIVGGVNARAFRTVDVWIVAKQDASITRQRQAREVEQGSDVRDAIVGLLFAE